MKTFLVAMLALVIATVAPDAAELPLSAMSVEDQVELLFAPDRDLLDLKLTVDAMIDPSASTVDGKVLVEELAARLLPMVEGIETSNGKLQELRRFLYRSGPWNDHRPFAYDMADPFGRNPVNKLLIHYMRTRLGNCVTMPMLAVILGRRIGLKMTLSTAPLHVFVKYTDDVGKVWNLEATSGLGFTRDLWYRRELPMSDRAIANGIYMRSLSEQENAALVVTLMIEDMMRRMQPEHAITVANAVLRHNSRDAVAHVWRGSAFALILRRDIISAFPNPEDLPLEMRAYADQLYRLNLTEFAKAEAMGWTREDGIKPELESGE